MKIFFKEWYEGNSVPDTSKALFDESVMCFRIGAYRSAYIMAYSGFAHILRERILTSEIKPLNISEEKWKEIICALQDEDKADDMIKKCVDRNNDNRVFLISYDIKSEFLFLKSLRNKCAHGKSGNIDYYHVELLWNYIMDNYFRFTIEGNTASLIHKILDHFDYTKTAPGAPVDTIVDNIKLFVKGGEYSVFFEELFTAIKDEINKINTTASVFSNSYPYHRLWEGIFKDAKLYSSFVEFVKGKSFEVITQFVYYYPSAAAELLKDESIARSIWMDKVFSEEGWSFGRQILIKEIINTSCVPDDEQERFYARLFDYIGMSYPESMVKVLVKTDYFERLRKKMLVPEKYRHGYKFANSCADSFVKMITDEGLDDVSVRCINNLFSTASFGRFYDEIKEWMNATPNAIICYKKIVDDNGLEDYSDKFKVVDPVDETV